MDKKLQKQLEILENKAMKMVKNPWVISHKPFKVVENVYFVGTSWVSIFLIDTDEGLVLVDCAMQETLYLLIDSIHSLGFDPKDIKKLLITHGHFDHCGAARSIQEMSGCEIWLGKGDEFFFTERRDLIAFEELVPEFNIDNFYDYGSLIDMGNIKIKPVHCPGHTPGTTSLFFDVDNQGEKLTCAVHGGLGSSIMSKGHLKANRLPLSLQSDYIESIEKVIDCKVDVVLPSHAGHCIDHDFLNLKNNKSGTNEYINPIAWKKMLSHKKNEMLELMKEDD